jgi:hypothetical protein
MFKQQEFMLVAVCAAHLLRQADPVQCMKERAYWDCCVRQFNCILVALAAEVNNGCLGLLHCDFGEFCTSWAPWSDLLGRAKCVNDCIHLDVGCYDCTSNRVCSGIRSCPFHCI